MGDTPEPWSLTRMEETEVVTKFFGVFKLQVEVRAVSEQAGSFSRSLKFIRLP
jgi:hypothetical protein